MPQIRQRNAPVWLRRIDDLALIFDAAPGKNHGQVSIAVNGPVLFSKGTLTFPIGDIEQLCRIR